MCSIFLPLNRASVAGALLALLAMFALRSAAGANITVTSTADSGPGTLRAALAAAANNDVVNFALTLPAKITLTSGELLVSGNVTVAGPGAANLTISGNNGSRVFHVGTSNTVMISGLTISDGLATAGGVGAAIFVDNAGLNLMNCVIRDSHANGGSTAGGGGIYSSQSQLTVISCTIDGNIASGNGGGIYNTGGILTIDRSTISGNSAINGGGVYTTSGTANLSNCLLFTNTATHGGGIGNVGALGTATLTLSNCTLSSNTVSGASATGSQVHNARQLTNTSATLTNCTLLSNNVAPTYAGGAVYNDNGGSVSLGSTIIQTSLQEHSIVNAGASSVMSAGYNLTFDNGGGFLTGPSDQISTDPLLDIGTGPRDNGGPTFTIALQANSPAMDKGKMFGGGADQRGEPRPFNDPNVGNAVGGDGSDIGAYEADLRQTSLVRVINDLQFSFTSIVGKSYQLQGRASLVSGTWTGFGNIVAGNGGIVPLTATGAFPNTVGFYRVLQSP